MAQLPDHRSAPRRRGQELVDAILHAAVEELLDVGYAGLSYESVARRSGASKVSIYRRWPSKEELVRAAAMRRASIPQLPDGPSSLEADLLLVFQAMARQIHEPSGKLVRSLLAASLAQQAPAMSELSWGMGSEMMRTVAQRAVDRGELERSPRGLVLRAPLDLFKQRFISHGEVSDEFIAELVEQVALPLWKRSFEA